MYNTPVNNDVPIAMPSVDNRTAIQDIIQHCIETRINMSSQVPIHLSTLEFELMIRVRVTFEPTRLVNHRNLRTVPSLANVVAMDITILWNVQEVMLVMRRNWGEQKRDIRVMSTTMELTNQV